MDMQDKVDHDMRLELEVEEIPLTLNHDARAEEAEALGVAADLMQQVRKVRKLVSQALGKV
jgi:hypothetical protein